MSTDCGLRGLDLLDAAIAHIETHPEEWRQESYRCQSGMCVAGWVCELAGGRWAGPPGGEYGSFLVAEADDPPVVLLYTSDPPLIGARHRAERLLGFSHYMDDALGRPDDDRVLFWEDNSLDDIRAMRDDLRAKAAEVAR